MMQDTETGAAQPGTEGPRFSPDKTYHNLPLIVIAGRPNVGKSTLFNALTRSGRAITDAAPGVTRDGVEGVCFLAGRPVRLMDTGGYKLTRRETGGAGESENALDDLVVKKTLSALDKADRILLVLDGTDFTAEDEELIAELRRRGAFNAGGRLVCAVNKTEGGKASGDSYNYLKYGFRSVTLISAKYGDGLAELAERVTEGLDFSRVTEGREEDAPVRIAVLGKPNVGKSTLANALTHTETSIVSDVAGTTRDVVEGTFRYSGRDIELLDTAGIRRKSRVKDGVEYYSVTRAIKTLDECDIAFIMIDAGEGLSEQDKKITALAAEKGRPVIFVLNKWDLREDRSAKAERAAHERIRIMFSHMGFSPIVTLSAKNRDGLKRLMDTALEVYAQLTRRIETSALNAALKDWLERYPPPASNARRFKIRYMTQTGVNPVSFVIFATRPESVPPAYDAYLKNRIREDLGFSYIPVLTEFRASRTERRAPGARRR